MQVFSKWGLIAVVAYLFFVASTLFYATQCTENFCGLIAFVAILPWPILLNNIDAYVNYGSHVSTVFVVINTLITYLIFALLQRRMQRK